MSLHEHHVVIMGGSNGMGLATAARALGEGAKVTLAGRSAERLQAAMAQLRQTFPKAAVHGEVADFTDDEALARLFGSTGPVDHLVLAASSDIAWGPFAQTSRAALANALQHKLLGYWATLQAALPRMKLDGSVVMLTGGASRAAIPGTAGLAAVNGAITQMAHTLARELAPLRINVISPGLVRTPAYDGMPEAAREGMFAHAARTLPVGRVGDADDIAAAAVMLMANTYASGVLLDLDGGAHLGG